MNIFPEYPRVSNEKVLHFLWQERQYTSRPLKLVNNDSLQVSFPGFYNRDAGPDFNLARITIAGLLWIGSVEIHLRSSDWLRHHHDKDNAYDRVILHVVWENDCTILGSKNRPIPCLELRKIVSPQQLDRYNDLVLSNEIIPCVKFLPGINHITILSMLERTSVERMEKKTREIEQIFNNNTQNWDQLCWLWIGKHFGFKVNNDAFDHLVRSVEYPILLRTIVDGNIEALLLGQAGMLPKRSTDPYIAKLRTEYNFLNHKFNLQPSIAMGMWRYLRMRPANFPSIRIAQLAALFQRYHRIFSYLINCKSKSDYFHLFSVPAGAYWKNHYIPAKKSGVHASAPGRSSIENLLINCVAPLIFFYGKITDQQTYTEKAMNLLAEIQAENNRKIRYWNTLGFSVSSAFESQGVIQLMSEYCLHKKCLDCKIGTNILRN